MRDRNTFPSNPWYDKGCKAAKKAFKKDELNKKRKISYEKLIRVKKERYVTSRREELISLGKHNLRRFWKELQQKKQQIRNNIMDSQWFDYAKLLYKRIQDRNTPPRISTSIELFSIEDIKRGIKNLVSNKAKDIDGLKAEILKWGMELLALHILDIFNKVNQNNFLTSWTTSVVMPLHE